MENLSPLLRHDEFPSDIDLREPLTALPLLTVLRPPPRTAPGQPLHLRQSIPAGVVASAAMPYNLNIILIASS